MLAVCFFTLDHFFSTALHATSPCRWFLLRITLGIIANKGPISQLTTHSGWLLSFFTLLLALLNRPGTHYKVGDYNCSAHQDDQLMFEIKLASLLKIRSQRFPYILKLRPCRIDNGCSRIPQKSAKSEKLFKCNPIRVLN